jgi:hypothetical protein
MKRADQAGYLRMILRDGVALQVVGGVQLFDPTMKQVVYD